MTPFLRLRQVCLVAADLAGVVDDLCAVFGIEVCHRDPNVAKYGLVNALMPVGTSFIEVVSPQKPGTATAAGRFLARRGGDGGYMVINDCDDVAVYRERAARLGIRAVEDHDYPGKAHLLQLHPRDTGGAILEFDTHIGGAALTGAYQWAGPEWQTHVRTTRVRSIDGVVLQSDNPVRLAARWGEIAGRAVTETGGTLRLKLDYAELDFRDAADGRGEGLSAIKLGVHDRAAIFAAAQQRGLRVSADQGVVTVAGVDFILG